MAGRGILLVLDSLGVGASADADRFGDAGANTLGHIAEYCATGRCDNASRSGPLAIPHLNRLGLMAAAKASSGEADYWQSANIEAAYGYAKELSTGKDTSSGHWEMAGVPVFFDWTYFGELHNSMPAGFLDSLLRQGNLPGLLGNCHASGTQIIAELGLEHMRTGKPIIYTSADSVVQIAAHEQSFGLDRLLDLCQQARALLDGDGRLNVGRVIARPFIGDGPDNFKRTANRRDYSVPPPAPTLLERLLAAERRVFGVGKISDIYAAQGVSHCLKAEGIDGLFDASLEALKQAAAGDLVFTNFVDFDSSYGHRRDVAGYAAALEQFDRRLPELMAAMAPDDLLLISADHGCDPSWPGSDHTREHVPVLAYGAGLNPGFMGARNSFADIGQSLAQFFAIDPLEHGDSFISD